MSIIYDALSKTQKNREATVYQAMPERSKTKQAIRVLGVFLLLSCLVAAAITCGIYYERIHRYFFPPKQIVAMKPAPKPHIKFTLNGVFLSGEEKIAMINKELLHLGDTIDGMRVTHIELDSVKLQDQFGAVLLPVAT